MVGPGRREIVFDTIVVNDETKSMDGQIVACRRIDHQWIFQRLRTDRKHPNARRTIESIMNDLSFYKLSVFKCLNSF